MTGTADHCARLSMVAWLNVRATMPLTQRSRLRATSSSGSRAPMGPSAATQSPPSCLMASSKVRRVRREGFSKRRAIYLLSSECAYSRGAALTAAARSRRETSSSSLRSRSRRRSGEESLVTGGAGENRVVMVRASCCEFLFTQLNNYTFWGWESRRSLVG